MLISNPWIVIYPSYPTGKGKFILEDLKAKRRFLLPDSAYLKLIVFCSIARQREEVVEYAKTLVGFACGPLLKNMTSNNVLVDSKSSYCKLAKAAKEWTGFGWSDALDYWIATKDYPFLDYSDVESVGIEKSLMKHYSKMGKPPSNYKAYNDAKRIRLSENLHSLDNVNLNSAMLVDFTKRKANKDPMSLGQLSELLSYPFSSVGHVITKNQGKFLIKLVPSGGARHPAEAYAILLNSKVGQGVFHYSVRDGVLEQIHQNVNTEQLEHMIYQLRQVHARFEPKLVLVISLVFPRSMWRYRESRTYRAVHHDLGHIIETLRLVCNARGLNFYFGYGMDENALESYLKLNSKTESVICFVAIG
jgi:SagB-type dehydrogenase family enzyme